MSFKNWIAQLNQDLPNNNIPVNVKEEEWWKFVDQLILTNPNLDIPIANKLLFPEIEDWRNWAKELIKSLN